jgi:hypothetical protein
VNRALGTYLKTSAIIFFSVVVCSLTQRNRPALFPEACHFIFYCFFHDITGEEEKLLQFLCHAKR